MERPTAMHPGQFADMEQIAKTWALSLESERSRARIADPMHELRAFYDAVTPRLSESLAYLDRFPLEAMPENAKRLLRVTFALMEIAHSVERWKRPDLPGAFKAQRLEIALDPPI